MKIPGHLHLEEIKVPAGQEWQDEGGHWRFLRLSNGAAYWLCADRPRAINPGEVLVLGPIAKGAIRASQLNEVILHGFSFEPEMLYGFFTLAERSFFENGLTEVEGEAQFLPSTHTLAMRFGARVSRKPGAELAGRAELLALASEFFAARMGQAPPTAGPELFPQQRFRQLVGQMPDLEMINHTPEELANLCGCSSRHFNRLFHQCFGRSPRAHLTELRLVRASQLLAGSGQKIGQVAQASGYRSQSLFNALFKRRFGMSPSEWRNRAADREKLDPLKAGGESEPSSLRT